MVYFSEVRKIPKYIIDIPSLYQQHFDAKFEVNGRCQRTSQQNLCIIMQVSVYNVLLGIALINYNSSSY